MSNSVSCWISANFRFCLLLLAGSAHANTRKRFCRLRKPEKRFGNLFGGESAWFLLSVSPLSLIWRLLLVLMLHRGRGWVFHPRGLTATSNTLTKPSETVVAGSKVPSALPANTRDVCVALGLVCACSCEQETVCKFTDSGQGMSIWHAQRRNA